MPRVIPKAERIARQRIVRFLYEQSINEDDILPVTLRNEVPDAWHTLEHDLDVQEPKVKVTLRLDESVARFYRGMGVGYQARISRILALWAHMKIANQLRLEDRIHEGLEERNRLDAEARARGERTPGIF